MEYDGFKVGQAIRALRRKNGMTLEDMSEAVGRTTAHLNMVELGSRRISFDLLYALMTVFHTDANSVLGLPSENLFPADGQIREASVDERLWRMEPEHRAYLTEIFMHMLDKISAINLKKEG